MNKAFWIKIVSIALIFFALVGVCVYEDRLVVNTFSKVLDYCLEIENTATQKNTIVDGDVTALVDNLEYCWEVGESALCFLVNHKSIEQMGIEIVRLKTYIQEEEEIEFFVSLKLIEHYVESFQHFMGASFHNIL